LQRKGGGRWYPYQGNLDWLQGINLREFLKKWKMEGLLKGSCDACTASKVKCSGGNPCERCQMRDIACSYRPKRKRGPQKGFKTGKAGSSCSTVERNENEDDFSFVSTYERRVWSVFFTMFKNQNRTRTETAWAWCWFVSQLEKLKKHLVKIGNVNALNRLSAWLEALDVDLKSVVNGMKEKCEFDPNMCGSCSAVAMCPPNQVGADASNLITELHIGRQIEINRNDKPRLVVKLSSGHCSVDVNQKFTSTFGYNGVHFEDMVMWSAGGFLPWGGDILAKLLVKESDLHVFLQILAIKFQALGPPEHGLNVTTEREIPSTHIFELWCTEKQGEEPSKKCMFMLRCVHVERIENDVMTTQLKISFEQIGEKKNPAKGEMPVSFEIANKDKKVAPNVKASFKRKSEGKDSQYSKRSKNENAVNPSTSNLQIPILSTPITPSLSSSSSSRTSGNNADPQQAQPLPQLEIMTSFDRLPQPFVDYYDNWSMFDPVQVHQAQGADSFIVQERLHQQRQNAKEIPFRKQPSLTGELCEDSEWLNSLLEWSAVNEGLPAPPNVAR